MVTTTVYEEELTQTLHEIEKNTHELATITERYKSLSECQANAIPPIEASARALTKLGATLTSLQATYKQTFEHFAQQVKTDLQTVHQDIFSETAIFNTNLKTSLQETTVAFTTASEALHRDLTKTFGDMTSNATEKIDAIQKSAETLYNAIQESFSTTQQTFNTTIAISLEKHQAASKQIHEDLVVSKQTLISELAKGLEQFQVKSNALCSALKDTSKILLPPIEALNTNTLTLDKTITIHSQLFQEKAEILQCTFTTSMDTLLPLIKVLMSKTSILIKIQKWSIGLTLLLLLAIAGGIVFVLFTRRLDIFV